MKTLLLLTLSALLLFGTCCGSRSTVQAATPFQTTAACTTERFYEGLIETADYLQFASQACLISQDVSESYTLKFAHTVQAADLETGSNTGSNFEWAFWVEFQLPNSRMFKLFSQYDKHQDVAGNRHDWRTFPVPITLPAGTVVTIRRPALPDAYCTKPGPWGDSQGCATGQKVELVGTLQ
jgi:hypothetical protein